MAEVGIARHSVSSPHRRSVDVVEEAELVRRVAAGDRAAFRCLVETHQRPLSAYARRMLFMGDAADDVVQETLLRLWTKASHFDSGAARLTTWLHRIAHNLCIDRQRKGARLTALEDGWDIAGDESPEVDIQREEQSRRVQDALSTLPERQRSALLLCHYQGLSNREAAMILDVGVEALESLLSRARRRLRQDLEIET